MTFPFQEQVRWSRGQIATTQALIAEELAATEAREGLGGVRAFLEHALSALESDLDPTAQLRRFVFLVSTLTMHAEHGWFSLPEVNKLVTVGEAILQTQGITPGTSKLSFMYSDLYIAHSHAFRRAGDHWRASWRAQYALFLAKGDERSRGFHALTAAHYAHRFGSLALALEAYSVAEAAGLVPALLERCQVGKIQALRLAGRLQESSTAAADLMASRNVSEAAGLELGWEAMCREAQGTGDITALVNSIGRGQPHRHSAYMLEATLWAKAVSSRRWLDWVPKAESIRKNFPDSLRRGTPPAFFYECALRLDRCYDNQIPLANRLNDVGELLQDVHELQSFDRELLVRAAVARWLVRYHQYPMAALALAGYQAMSLRASDGTSADTLGILGDLDIKTWLRFDQAARDAAATERRSARRIKSSRLARATDVTMMATKVGGAILKGKVKRINAAPEDTRRIVDDELQEIAEIVVDTAGRLKGPVAKVAQVLSLAAGSLSPRARERLSALRDRMEPLEPARIREMVEAALGRPVGELFSEWDDTPISAASIGQIHRARTIEGQDVVVKVQYPGIQEAIKSDLQMIKMAKPILRRIFPSANIDEVLDISLVQVLAETDYAAEAAMQTEARACFADDPAIVIPKVIPHLSTGNVLTSEYLPGLKFDDFINISSQEEKNLACATIYRFSWTSFLRFGIMNGDPHPGNFVFLNEGRVGFLDFGYSCRYAPARLELWRAYFRALIDDDYARFKELILALDFIGDPGAVDWGELWESARGMGAAMRSTTATRFSQHRVARNFEQATFRSVNRKAMRLPVEDAMLMRFGWCLQQLFGQIGGEVHWQGIIGPLLYSEDAWKERLGRVG